MVCIMLVCSSVNMSFTVPLSSNASHTKRNPTTTGEEHCLDSDNSNSLSYNSPSRSFLLDVCALCAVACILLSICKLKTDAHANAARAVTSLRRRSTLLTQTLEANDLKHANLVATRACSRSQRNVRRFMPWA